jgi:tetratricopeptide (TPR) repeat protein
MPVQAETLNEIGDITVEVNTGGGEFQATTAIPVKDIKRFLALMGPGAQEGTTAAGTLKVPAPPEGTGEADDKATADEAPVVKDAQYWFHKGGLVAAYGNDKAAIRYFQKSLELDPTNSTALFNMGISYGELGEFERAITAINQAIALDPTQDVYYYGRGRVHLLAGDGEAARRDIARAAQGGHPDAVAYLRKHPTP